MRTAAAVGLGIFIGCLPLWGVHLAICVLVGRLLHLSRLKMYLAANISNPLVLPFLLLAQIQVGRFARRGDFYELTLQDMRLTPPWLFGADLAVGSLIVGVGLGVLGAAITLVFTRTPGATDDFLWKAADRYLVAGVTPWEFARQKLTSDPVYFDVLRRNVLPQRGPVARRRLRTGTAAVNARHGSRRGGAKGAGRPSGQCHRNSPCTASSCSRGSCAWRASHLVPMHPSKKAMSATRLAGQWDAIALVDVLHMLKRPDQEAVLATVSAALAPGGVLLIREASAGASWRFAMVYLTNRTKAILQGRWRQPLNFRSRRAWCSALEGLGLTVDASDASRGTPFRNVLIVGREVN